MSGDETIPVDEAMRSLNWAMGRLAEVRAERDRYRDWFERLFAHDRVLTDLDAS